MSKRHVFVTVVLEKTAKVEERKKEDKQDQLDTDFQNDNSSWAVNL